MRKILFVLNFVIITFSSAVFAQTNLKLGYINSTELMQMMPGIDTVENALNAHRASLERTMETMIQEYQSKVEEYQNNNATMSQIIRQTKEREIQDMQMRIQQFQQTADLDLQRKRAELFNPLIERAQKAIADVAKEKGYTYILDSSTGAVAFYDNGENVLELVKAKLGIK